MERFNKIKDKGKRNLTLVDCISVSLTVRKVKEEGAGV
jgi:hypothetical protein